MNIILLIVALFISGIAGYFSIAGLMAIFSGAMGSIAVMGFALEVGKIATTVWLHKNFNKTPLWLRMYLSFAIAILMVITSMGIFAFLSKAHVQQSLGSDAVSSKISIIDNKISSLLQDQTSNNTTLKQLDTSITQVVSLSTTENGATKALSLRNSQQSERNTISNSLKDDQKQIDSLREEEAPLKLQLQKNEVDVGPIKFIAALIYGPNASQDLLEKAVRWVIILLVIVFDPLALAMIIAADSTFTELPKEETHDILEEGPQETVIEKVIEPEPIKKVRKTRKKKANIDLAEYFPEEVNDNGQKLVGKLILPDNAPDGALYISTETIPGKLYKVVSGKWTEVEKVNNPGYINSSYTQFLIKHLEAESIRTDQLTKDELESVEKYLENTNDK